MNAYERTLNFIQQKPVDRLPFHPIIMRFAARHAGVQYRDFCLDYSCKCSAMVKCARDFGIDWVTVMSDPYAEAEAFGMQIDYPADNLPIPRNLLIIEPEDVNELMFPEVEQSPRLLNRVNEITHFKQLIGDTYFIVGWVEGPMACYANLRGLQNTCLDLFEHPRIVAQAVDLFRSSASDFIARQIEAGAHCIGIGDAVCSQIGPEFYNQYGFPGEKEIVDFIHSHGVLAKLHICGDTTAILPMMIKTGADIIDIDHAVTEMARFAPLLSEHQVFSGNSDPVSVIQDGSEKSITESVRKAYQASRGRCIISAGCEITPDTRIQNLMILSNTTRSVWKEYVHTAIRS
jgi:uroporphyrinogen decarboxylase